MTNEEILGPLPERLREAKEAAAAFDATGVLVNYRSRPPSRPDPQLQYYVLPDDPLAALNILREAAGLDRLSEEDAPALASGNPSGQAAGG